MTASAHRADAVRRPVGGSGAAWLGPRPACPHAAARLRRRSVERRWWHHVHVRDLSDEERAEMHESRRRAMREGRHFLIDPAAWDAADEADQEQMVRELNRRLGLNEEDESDAGSTPTS
jgi:hypothetical protein